MIPPPLRYRGRRVWFPVNNYKALALVINDREPARLLFEYA